MIASMDRRAFLFACSFPALSSLTNLEIDPGGFIANSTSQVGTPGTLPVIPHPASTTMRTYLRLPLAEQWAGRLGFSLDPPVEKWEKLEGNDIGQTLPY